MPSLQVTGRLHEAAANTVLTSQLAMLKHTCESVGVVFETEVLLSNQTLKHLLKTEGAPAGMEVA